jgi:hypothetical protein
VSAYPEAVKVVGRFVADLVRVLRSRDFRRLFATRLLSQGADGVFQAGLAGMIFFSPERATKATDVAAAFAVSILPYTVVGPFAGVLLDRWRRRQVLLVTSLLRSLLAAAVALLSALAPPGPALYLAVLVCLSINRFFLSGLGAALPHVVPADELVMANAVTPTSGTLAALGGGALGYGLHTLAGGSDGAVVLLSALGYLAAALGARSMSRDLLGPDRVRPLPWEDAATVVGDVLVGLREAGAHLRDRPRTSGALFVMGCHRFCFGMVTLVTVLQCRYRFADAADPDAGFALLAVVLAASGAGFGAAALVTPVAARAMSPQTWMAVCLGTCGLAVAGFLAFDALPSLAIASFLVGTFGQGAKICVDALVQATVLDAFLGRVMSLYDLVFNVCFVVAVSVGALLLPVDGDSVAVLSSVVVLYALSALTAAAQARAGAPAAPPTSAAAPPGLGRPAGDRGPTAAP